MRGGVEGDPGQSDPSAQRKAESGDAHRGLGGGRGRGEGVVPGSGLRLLVRMLRYTSNPGENVAKGVQALWLPERTLRRLRENEDVVSAVSGSRRLLLTLLVLAGAGVGVDGGGGGGNGDGADVG